MPDGTVFSVGRWADCSWPAASGAGKDGLGVVYLKRVDDQKQASSDYLGADIFHTTCQKLRIQYRHDQQGIRAKTRVLEADNEQVLALNIPRGLDFQQASFKAAALPPMLAKRTNEDVAGSLIVLVPISTSVSQVNCA